MIEWDDTGRQITIRSTSVHLVASPVIELCRARRGMVRRSGGLFERAAG
jgi:hypothetical protein